MNNLLSRLPILFFILTLSCGSGTIDHSSNFSAQIDDQWSAYWYAGKAELTSYKLEQARYGEIHKGDAVLIFVTEDFSQSKQVKLDNPEQHPKDKVSILKLNLTKKFNTGIYPYSLMQSVFTPVDLKKHPHTLKSTMSGQEWCGHIFSQMNLGKSHYDIKLFSYFESEGDEQKKLPIQLLEDELWNRIRIEPKSLPTGKIELIPGMLSARLRHKPLQASPAVATLTEKDGENSYTIEYEDGGRKLTINFASAFPFEIHSWEESYRSGFGPQAKVLTTKAVKNKSMMLDYWSRHDNDDLFLRAELGLE